MSRFVFVTGGVVSSLGKGIAASALGALLKARGYTVRLKKMDPYLNIDPGTMNPLQHGEVFVTADGAETDLDVGHYERFAEVEVSQADAITCGRIYKDILDAERRGDFLGATVQVVPHVTNAIATAILARADEDFVIVEVGGTVGDIEALPFLESLRQLSSSLGREGACYIHATLVPYIAAAGELKTKPTQHSVRDLMNAGIRPDILLCRCDRLIPKKELDKVAAFTGVRPGMVIPALDAPSLSAVPGAYAAAGLDRAVLSHFGLPTGPVDLRRWESLVLREAAVRAAGMPVRVALVGKYVSLQDAYKSVGEALRHASVSCGAALTIDWIDAADLDGATDAEVSLVLHEADAILVPGGFGKRGTDGMMAAIRHARSTGKPFLGICFGMQLAVIETLRNLCGITDAVSSELDKEGTPVVGLLEEWATVGGLERRREGGDMGGTMRLGSYPAVLVEGTMARSLYASSMVTERHRHRYEVDGRLEATLREGGMLVSGWSPDGKLPEIIEKDDHPFFIACQFHPEFLSRPHRPHPLFKGFLDAACCIRQGVPMPPRSQPS